MSRVLVVGAVIVDDLTQPGRVLAARRTGPPALAGQWEFPGGKVERGETAEAALHREIAEELGAGITVGEELRPPVGDTWPLTDRLVMRTWWCTLTREPTVGPDHDELRWVGADDIEDLPWLPADRPIVARIRRHLGAA